MERNRRTVRVVGANVVLGAINQEERITDVRQSLPAWRHRVVLT